MRPSTQVRMLNIVLVKLEVHTSESLLRETGNTPLAFTKDQSSPVLWHLWVWLRCSTFLALERKVRSLLKMFLQVGSGAPLQTGTNMHHG